VEEGDKASKVEVEEGPKEPEGKVEPKKTDDSCFDVDPEAAYERSVDER
jgi:hypothetical protein